MPNTPPLAPHHLAMLEASAISAEVRQARGYYTATTKTALEALGFGRTQRLPGLVIPVYNVHGDLATYVLRPDAPRIPSGKSKPAKYEFMHGMHMTLDVPQVAVVRQALGNPQVPLWITEGSKKVDSLASQGCCAVAVLGVWNWRGTNDQGGKTALPDWDTIALNGRTVYIVYDSDVMLKDEVHDALARIGAYLQHRKAHVRYLYLPAGPSGAKVGIDDYLAQGQTVNEALDHASTQLKKPVQETPAGSQDGSRVSFPHLTISGGARPVLANVVTALTADVRWQDVLGYDAFLDCAMLRARPPYIQAGADPWQERPLVDTDDMEATAWMQDIYGLFVPVSLVHDALSMVAHRAPYHPILDYLTGIGWDGTPRLDTWLVTYCQAEDTLYTRAVGRKTLLGAVARVMQPGAKMDTVTVLETARQGTKKSTVWSTLATEPWFSDHLPPLHQKDAAQELRGKWIIELGELAALHSSEVEQIKRFISATQDHYRPSYGRRAVTFLRQNIFVGTTNKDTYLKDETGNRRFWPVALSGECAVDALQRDRDQLWAEAYACYQQGDIWYLSPELETLAAVEQDARLEDDPWEEAVFEYLQWKTEVTTGEIFERCLGLKLAEMHSGQSRRLGALLRKFKWSRTRGRITQSDDSRVRVRTWTKETDGTDGTDAQGKTQHIGPTISPNNQAVGTDGTDGTDTMRTYERVGVQDGEIHTHTPPYSIGSIGTMGAIGPRGEKIGDQQGMTPRNAGTYAENPSVPVGQVGQAPPCLHTWLKVDEYDKCMYCNQTRQRFLTESEERT